MIRSVLSSAWQEFFDLLTWVLMRDVTGGKTVKRLLMLLGILLAVPLLGWGVATAIQSHVDAGLAAKELPRAHLICSEARVRSSADLRSFCEEVDGIEQLRDASILVGIAALLLPFSFWFVSLVIGRSRLALALVVPALVRASLLVLALIVLIQGAIFVYAVFIGESYAIGRVHGVLLFIVGIGALFAGLTLVKHAITLGGKRTVQISAAPLQRHLHPEVFDLVDYVARKLDARPPDNIIVGLEPTFFATSAKVQLPDQKTPLKGETLFLSLSLCRVLSAHELTAIIGHELGHFRGKDTSYSLRFAPVYAGLGSAVQSITPAEGRDGAFHLMSLPALALLGYMLEVFAKKESRISREREFAADRAATEVAPNFALASGLLRVSAFAPLWDHCKRENIDRLNRGLVTKNLSLAFANVIAFDVDVSKLMGRTKEILETRIAHPTDSHPPVAERLIAVCGSIPQFNFQTFTVNSDSALATLGDLEKIEQTLTLSEHKQVLRAGFSQIPDEQKLTDDQKHRTTMLRCIHILGATIINADGRKTRAQFVAAEDLNASLPDFDRLDFRECCEYLNDYPDASVALKTLVQLLNDKGLGLVMNWLRAIADAEPPPSVQTTQWLEYIEEFVRRERDHSV